MWKKAFGPENRAQACRVSIYACACVVAVAAGCSSSNDDGDKAGSSTTTPKAGTSGSDGGKGGSSSTSTKPGGTQTGTGQSAQGGSKATTGGASGRGETAASGAPAAGSGDSENPGNGEGGNSATPVADDPSAPAQHPQPACGEGDSPETGIQGDKYPGTVNCGLTLLADVPPGGGVEGAGHCAYMRGTSDVAYGAGTITAFSLADPLNPKMTDTEPGVGGSESMRAMTVPGRSILVSGSGVYDVSNCEDIVKKGEIPWPSENAMNGLYFAALSSHEIAISHDAMRVYSGLGFAVAHIEDLEHSDKWTVSDWACEMSKQSNFPTDVPNACDGPVHQDVGRQYSHSSDDNLEGTMWYGANQNGDGFSAMEPATARMVDISDPNSIKILDTLHEFPGHSMNWWRTPDNRDFIIGANEGGGGDRCVADPRPTSLGNDLEAYIVEVTGNKFGKQYPARLDINKPENCMAANASGAAADISEHSVYNRNGAAMVMMEYGGAGLRVWDVRDGMHPKEIAYYNDGKGHVHSGQFYYDDARGIMLASGTQNMHVLMLEPQAIKALGLPMPTDPAYPYK